MAKFNHNLLLFPEIDPCSDTDPLFYESTARKHGYGLIAGIDEAGRGPLAGPVVAAAVILPPGLRIPGIRDSKKMTEKARDRAFFRIAKEALAVGIGVVSHRWIDTSNILKATLEAMKRAALYLNPLPDYLMVDGIHGVPLSIPQICIKKGDQRCLSISAASIMAKVYRDRIMQACHNTFPEYGFSENKGYGTEKHLMALKRYGPSSIHRLTFKGVC